MIIFLLKYIARSPFEILPFCLHAPEDTVVNRLGRGLRVGEYYWIDGRALWIRPKTVIHVHRRHDTGRAGVRKVLRLNVKEGHIVVGKGIVRAWFREERDPHSSQFICSRGTAQFFLVDRAGVESAAYPI